MAIVVGTNSWCTIAEADDFLEVRYGSQNWFTLDDNITPGSPGEASKELFLRAAYDLLLNHPSYDISATSTDSNVKKAQSEMAFVLSEDFSLYIEKIEGESSGVSSFIASKWSEKYFSSKEGYFSLPPLVMNYLSAYTGNEAIQDLEVE